MSQEKDLLNMAVKYFEMLHGQLTDIDVRLRVLEKTVASVPELQTANGLAKAEVKTSESPASLTKQLSAIQQAVQRLVR